MYKEERFIQRYNDGVIPHLNKLLEIECEFSKLEKPSLKHKTDFCLEIKYTYEYCWKTMKDFLKMNGKIVLLPRKIFKAMDGYINSEEWIELLDDINMFFSNRNNETVLDNIIANYYSKYEKMYDDFLHFITNQDHSQVTLVCKDGDFVHENHSVLDTVTFVKLVNLFCSHKSIKTVRLYGSRATSSFRKSSDLDLLIDGDYTLEEYTQIKNQLSSLNLPYDIDLSDLNNIEQKIYYDKKFYAKVKKSCIPFYDREDFE